MQGTSGPRSAAALSRRQFVQQTAAAAVASSLGATAQAARPSSPRFELRTIEASAMYGKLPLADVVAQVARHSEARLDLWGLPHADHREQAHTLGLDRVDELLTRHGVQLAATTVWPSARAEHLRLVHRFGGKLVITGFVPESDPSGFIERLAPLLELAEKLDVTLAIENHGASIEQIVSFARAARSPHLGVALAPYHLPQDAARLARLICDLGPKLAFFYAWQHGAGATQKLPDEQQRTQLPGLGPLDFGPLLQALREIDYQGLSEIFMHPVPRGVPIRPTAAEVAAEIDRATRSLEASLRGES